jgi:hypothetical protein
MNNLSLKRVLLANAIFSGLCAVDLLIFPAIIASYMGGFDGIYLQILGGGLVIFALYVMWVARGPIDAGEVKLIVAMDRSWIAGSIVLLLFFNHWFSYGGITLVSVVAVVVAAFSETQARLVKQLSDRESRV